MIRYGVGLWFGVVLLSAHMTAAAADAKVGVIDVAALLQGSPQAEKIQAQLRKEFEPRIRELQSQQDRIKSMEEDFSKNAVMLSEEQRKKKERDIIALRQDYKHAAENLQVDLRLREREEQGPLQEKLGNAIDSFGASNSYDLILGAFPVPIDDSRTVTTLRVIYAADGIDVTDRVLEVLRGQ